MEKNDNPLSFLRRSRSYVDSDDDQEDGTEQSDHEGDVEEFITEGGKIYLEDDEDASVVAELDAGEEQEGHPCGACPVKGREGRSMTSHVNFNTESHLTPRPSNTLRTRHQPTHPPGENEDHVMQVIHSCSSLLLNAHVALRLSLGVNKKASYAIYSSPPSFPPGFVPSFNSLFAQVFHKHPSPLTTKPPSSNPSTKMSTPPDSSRHVHFGDSFAPSALTLRLKLGPKEAPTMILKISVYFEHGQMPRIKVRTRRPREREHRRRTTDRRDSGVEIP